MKKYTQKRQKWMTAYQNALETRADHQPGRICWDTAAFLYNSGKDPVEAATKAHNPYKYEGAR